MNIMKIFKQTPIDRVKIKVSDVQKAKELTQAKGIMNNYLKDKHFAVTFYDSEDEYVGIQSCNDAKTAIRVIAVKKDSETPFLRNIYKALEIFAKDSDINKNSIK